MRLYYNFTSPFARKTWMMALVCNIDNLDYVKTNPMESEDLRQINPLGQVPALLDGETALFDSPLICEYLDSIHVKNGGKSFFKPEQMDYFKVALCHAQANGILNAAVSIAYENRRPEQQRSPLWLERWSKAIHMSIERFSIAPLGGVDSINIASIATIAMLDYLDFRLPHIDWRSLNPQLTQWRKSLNDVAWVTETLPHD